MPGLDWKTGDRGRSRDRGPRLGEPASRGRRTRRATTCHSLLSLAPVTRSCYSMPDRPITKRLDASAVTPLFYLHFAADPIRTLHPGKHFRDVRNPYANARSARPGRNEIHVLRVGRLPRGVPPHYGTCPCTFREPGSSRLSAPRPSLTQGLDIAPSDVPISFDGTGRERSTSRRAIGWRS